LYFLIGGLHTGSSGEIDHLPDQVRPGKGLPEKRLFDLFPVRELSASANGRKRGPYKDAAGA
jgi:hypothetical protein